MNPMIQHTHSFPLEKQIQLVVASMAIHNFIRLRSATDPEFQAYDDDDELLPQAHEGEIRREEVVEEQNSTHQREIDDVRDNIANLLMARRSSR